MTLQEAIQARHSAMYDSNVTFTDLPSLTLSLGKMIKVTLLKRVRKSMV